MTSLVAGRRGRSRHIAGVGALDRGRWRQEEVGEEPGERAEHADTHDEDERADVNVEEYLSSVHRFKTSEALTIETVLAEIDADYLALMIGGSVSTTAAAGGQKGFDSLPVGNDALLTSYAFGFEGIHVDINAVELTLRVFVYRATAKIGGELTFSKREDDYTGVPITVEALSDSATPGRLCVIEKVTAPVT